MSLGITEIVLILVVVVLIFGGKRIPELARGLGKAEAEYKKAKETIENEVSAFKTEVKEISAKKKTPAKKKKTTTKAAASAPKKTTKRAKKNG